MKKVAGLIFGLLPVTVSAECVPVPDCASIGYTETSCDGDSLKCPFDTTKLYCPPCDSSFRYTCIGDNIKNPIGDSCNNKYAACECENRTTFVNGECLCDSSCDTIGNIYYSDGTCSSCNITDKTPIGIVAYHNATKHLIVSLEQIAMSWSSDQTDTDGNTSIVWNKDISALTNYSTVSAVLTDYNGFENTQFIVEVYGENATNVAAVYCYNYAPTGLEYSKGQWYLPALGELYAFLYYNISAINNGIAALGTATKLNGNYWSSSETNYYTAWHAYSNNVNIPETDDVKNAQWTARCIYSIL